VTCFAIDWETRTVTCPQGHTNTAWKSIHPANGPPLIRVGFAKHDCQSCPVRQQCTRSPTARVLTLHPREQHVALLAARERESTPAFKEQYKARAGIEGTFSQAVRVMALRRTRYIGLAKTHLHHLGIAAALNLARVVDWLAEKPRAKTRISHFASLAAA
jgi:transposase